MWLRTISSPEDKWAIPSIYYKYNNAAKFTMGTGYPPPIFYRLSNNIYSMQFQNWIDKFTQSSSHFTFCLNWLHTCEFQNQAMLDAPFKIIHDNNISTYLYMCNSFRYKSFKHCINSSVWWGHDNSRTCVLSNEKRQYGRVKGYSRWTVQYTATIDVKLLAKIPMK